MWIRCSFIHHEIVGSLRKRGPARKEKCRKSVVGRVFYVQELKVHTKPRAGKRECKTQPKGSFILQLGRHRHLKPIL